MLDGKLAKNEFWNKKILSWERAKYNLGRWKKADVNSSVKYRLNLASNLLNQVSNNKNILELGSGSGLLWQKLNLSSLASYRGVDFSSVAIASFRERAKECPKTTLFCDDCTSQVYPADIVVSLGLLDWINAEEMEKIAFNYRHCYFLHSFSEKRISLSRAIHQLYVFVSYGYKNLSYTPSYYREKELLSIFGAKAKIYRHPQLKFGAFIYHLPWPH